MQHVLSNIQKGDVICITEDSIYPLRTNNDFFSVYFSGGGRIQNAEKSYQKDDTINLPIEPFDFISTEAKNIKKLNKIKKNATGLNKKNINSLILRKVNALSNLNSEKIC
jgi:hypothetical protein